MGKSKANKRSSAISERSPTGLASMKQCTAELDMMSDESTDLEALVDQVCEKSL